MHLFSTLHSKVRFFKQDSNNLVWTWPNLLALIAEHNVLVYSNSSVTYLLEESWHFRHFFSLSPGWLPTLANTATGCNHWPKLTGLCELLLLHCVLFRNLPWQSPCIYYIRLGWAEAFHKRCNSGEFWQYPESGGWSWFTKDVTMLLF